MESWVWASIIVPAALALIGAIWLLFRAKVERTESRLDDHIKDDNKAHERVAVVESKIERIEKDIGDHESGIRGWLHKLSNDVSPYIIKKQRENKE